MPQPQNPGLPRPNTKAYEDRLLQGASQEFPPTSPYRQLLNDEFVDNIVIRNHAQALHIGALNAEIRAGWDQLSAQYPNADHYMRTIEAWKGAHSRPGARATLDIVQRSTHSEIRALLNASRLRDFTESLTRSR